MVAATVKVGGKIFVQIEVLQAIKARLDGLPTKQKTSLNLNDAVMFLYPGIKGAVQKHYTKDEILQIIINEGWKITQNSFRYLWSIFLSEDGNSNKRKPYVKSVRKIKAEKTNSAIESNKNNIAVKNNAAVNEASLSSKVMAIDENNVASANSNAHFDLMPDTEDL